jgi:hypothetical protein
MHWYDNCIPEGEEVKEMNDMTDEFLDTMRESKEFMRRPKAIAKINNVLCYYGSSPTPGSPMWLTAVLSNMKNVIEFSSELSGNDMISCALPVSGTTIRNFELKAPEYKLPSYKISKSGNLMSAFLRILGNAYDDFVAKDRKEYERLGGKRYTERTEYGKIRTELAAIQRFCIKYWHLNPWLTREEAYHGAFEVLRKRLKKKDELHQISEALRKERVKEKLQNDVLALKTKMRQGREYFADHREAAPVIQEFLRYNKPSVEENTPNYLKELHDYIDEMEDGDDKEKMMRLKRVVSVRLLEQRRQAQEADGNRKRKAPESVPTTQEVAGQPIRQRVRRSPEEQTVPQDELQQNHHNNERLYFVATREHMVGNTQPQQQNIQNTPQQNNAGQKNNAQNVVSPGNDGGNDAPSVTSTISKEMETQQQNIQQQEQHSTVEQTTAEEHEENDANVQHLTEEDSCANYTTYTFASPRTRDQIEKEARILHLPYERTEIRYHGEGGQERPLKKVVGDMGDQCVSVCYYVPGSEWTNRIRYRLIYMMMATNALYHEYPEAWEKCMEGCSNVIKSETGRLLLATMIHEANENNPGDAGLHKNYDEDNFLQDVMETIELWMPKAIQYNIPSLCGFYKWTACNEMIGKMSQKDRVAALREIVTDSKLLGEEKGKMVLQIVNILNRNEDMIRKGKLGQTKNPCDPFQTAVINMNEEENDVMVFGEYFYDGRMTQPYN